MILNTSAGFGLESHDINSLVEDVGKPPIGKCIEQESIEENSKKMGTCKELSDQIKDIFSLNNPRAIKRSKVFTKEDIQKNQKLNHFVNIQYSLTRDKNGEYTPYMKYKMLQYHIDHPKYVSEKLSDSIGDYLDLYNNITDEKSSKLFKLSVVEHNLKKDLESSLETDIYEQERLHKLRESVEKIFNLENAENLKTENDIYNAVLGTLELKKNKEDLNAFKEPALIFLKAFYRDNYKKTLAADSIEDAEILIAEEQNRLDTSKLENFGAVDHMHLIHKNFDLVKLETFKIENVGENGDKNNRTQNLRESYGNETDITYSLSTTSEKGKVNSMSINFNTQDEENFNHLNENNKVESIIEFGEQSMGPTIIFTQKSTTFGTSTSFEIENCKIKSAEVRGMDLGIRDVPYKIDHKT